jgi:hypothetical protein
MAKLTGAKKAEFLARMEKGRRKAAKATGKPAPKKRTAPAAQRKKTKTRPSKQTTAKKNPAKKPAARKPPTKATHKHTTTKRQRRNPDTMQAAEAMYESFHGRPAERTIEIEQTINYPAHFAEMGRLTELRFHLDKHNPDFPLTGFKKCQAVCTPDGQNIYFVGGDQSLDLAALNIDCDKDVVELGPCTYISYDTKKGFHNFEQVDYFHRFGEEDGIRPTLNYDRLNNSLFLASGNYRVRPEGIRN